MEIGKWTLGEKKKEILNPNIQRISRFLQIAKTAEVVIPGKRSATRNPGLSKKSGFRLSPE
jgi:hypothetical protein